MKARTAEQDPDTDSEEARDQQEVREEPDVPDVRGCPPNQQQLREGEGRSDEEGQSSALSSRIGPMTTFRGPDNGSYPDSSSADARPKR
jgi:hypothetical protein